MAKRAVSARDLTPLLKAGKAATELPTGEAFRSEWIDFERGIRVGNIEPHERITQILKYFLEQRYATRFVTDRWGRGVYWQWICWLPRANRLAKPISSGASFGCAKLFISAEQDDKVFKCGLQVERGVTSGEPDYPGTKLQKDWDWHRLIAQCREGTALDAELRRLAREGFAVQVGDWERPTRLDAATFRSGAQVREAARRCRRDNWAGFQLYYPMPQSEVAACTGLELVRAVQGVFVEVVPAMNLCMQITLKAAGAGRRP
jgi:hypothetical protein